MKKLLIGGVILVMAIAIPVTLTLVSQQQDVRQRAAEITQSNCNNYSQQYFSNLSNQPYSGQQYYQQYQSQFAAGNCPSTYPLPSQPPAIPTTSTQPTGSVQPTGSGTSTGGFGNFSSYLCSYYQGYLAKLQSAGTCTSNPTVCNQVTTQLQNLKCASTSPSQTPTPKVSGSPTGTAPTFPPITPANPPIYNALVDLNDDGKIDELDLNILYSGFSKRKGD